MNVGQLRSSTLEEGVLRLLRERGVLEAGSKVRLTELLILWRETRLRHDDLVGALVRLQAAGMLHVERDATGARYVLDAPGAARLKTIPEEPPAILFLVAVTAAHGEVHRSDINLGRPGRHRRKTDGPLTIPTLPDIDPPT